MSNIQAQIDALAGSIQVLDNTVSNITGNTLSNYNQLSRIVAQQGNIYNSVYFGVGDILTKNLIVNNDTTISGNLNVDNILWVNSISNRVGILNTNPQQALDVAGDSNISGNIIVYGQNNRIGNVTGTGTTSINSFTTHLNSDRVTVCGDGTSTNGFLRFTKSSNIIYMQPGLDASVGGSFIPLIISRYSAATRSLTINDDRVGVGNMNGTSIPSTLYVYGNTSVTDSVSIGSTTYRANLFVNGNTLITGNLNVDNGTMWVDATNNRIGVLNTNPQYALDVKGDSNITGSLYVGGAVPVESTSAIIRNATVDTATNGTVSGTSINILGLNNGVRSWYYGSDGANNSQFYFGTSGGDATNPDYFCFWDTSGRMMVYPPATGTIVGPNGTDQFTVRGNANITGNLIITRNLFGSNVFAQSNIGINTLNPSANLDVIGNARISGNVNIDNGLLWTDPLNNRIGILNTNPQYTLDITGNVNFTGNLFQNGNIFTSGGGGGSSQWTTSGANIYYNVLNGNVGIGTTTPYYKLDIGGSANIGANVYCMNMFVINDCLVQGGDFSIMNGNLTVYKRFNTFGESVLNGNLTVYNSDFYNYGNSYIYNGLYLNKNGALYTNNDAAGQHAFYSFDTVNLMSTLYGGADDTNRVGYFQARGYGGGLPLLLNPNGGNVGVGTGVPRSTLSVSGNAVITGNVNIDNGLVWTDPVNNRVGINNTNPQYDLDVKGSANVSGNMILTKLGFPTSINLITPFTMDYYTSSTVASLGSALYGNATISFGKTYNSVLGIWPSCYASSTGVGIDYSVSVVTTSNCTISYYNSRGSTASNFSFYILVLGT